MKRVVLTGDFLRTNEKGEPLQFPNVGWLLGVTRDNLQAVMDRDPMIWFGSPGPFYEDMGLKPSIDNWAASYFREPGEIFVNRIQGELSESVVCGVELSPLLLRAFDLAEIPWIDISVGPLRFLEDLTVMLRFSRHFDLSVLSAFLLSEEEIAAGVDRVRRFYGGYEIPYRDSIIFFLQTRQDRSMISSRGFVETGLVVESLKELTRDRKLLIKRHPMASNSEMEDIIVDSITGRVIEDNTYLLLSKKARAHNNVYVAVSSSVIHESRVFGNEMICFNSDTVSWLNTGRFSLTCYRDPRFWSAVLGQVLPIREREWEPIAFVPNFLRRKLGNYSLDPAIWQQ